MAADRAADFRNVTAAIGDSNARMLRSLGNCLIDMGFRQVIESPTISGLRKYMEDNSPDLLILDDETLNGEARDFTRDIRHQKLGPNPFVVVMNVVASGNEDGAALSIDSGSDELISVPLEIETFRSRVAGFARTRKKFVITSDYIGPTRRRARRSGSAVNSEFEVPNPIRAKAEGMDHGVFLERVRQTTSTLNQRKFESQTLCVAKYIDDALERYKSGGETAHIIAGFDILDGIMAELSTPPPGLKDHFDDLCQLTTAVLKDLRQIPRPPSAKKVKALRGLADGFRAAAWRGSRQI